MSYFRGFAPKQQYTLENGEKQYTLEKKIKIIFLKGEKQSTEEKM
jgi:hypothetical protein